MEIRKEKKSKIALLLVGLSILIGMTAGVTFAFYNYNSEGEANIVKAGNLEFSSNYTSVTLTNVFPIDSEDVLTSSKVETITVSVTGGTTYSRGIEYLISLTDVENYINGKNIPVSINVTTSGLGDSDSSYFTNRGSTSKIYKVIAQEDMLNDERLVVGYIPKSSTNTEGTITIRAYLDDSKIVISDTFDGSESNSMATTNDYVDGRTVLTTDEWKAIKTTPISFKVLVEAYEGVWVNDFGTLYDEILSRAARNEIASYNQFIRNYSFKTQDTVGENENKLSVNYFVNTKALDIGNVLFGGYCWQIVRTTDDGGIKIIYNGVADNNQCKTTRSQITRKGLIASRPNVQINGPYLYAESYDYNLETGKFNLVNPDNELKTWSFANYKDFIGKYTCFNSTGTDCNEIWHIGHYLVGDYTRAVTTKFTIGNIDSYQSLGTSSYNVAYYSLSNVGYMYNDEYAYLVENTDVGALYGKNVNYENGEYFVYDDNTNDPLVSSVADENHHYTCGTVTSEVPDRTCTKVRFYFSEGKYIELKNGDNSNDAIRKMLNYKFDPQDEDLSINTISSTIKNYLEVWYDKNLKQYESFIDTNAVFCNNRSVLINNNEPYFGGWNSQGGSLSSHMRFFYYAGSRDLACDNVTDRFSKANSLAPLKNPIGLLTEAERGILQSDYVAIGVNYWLNSPKSFGSAPHIRQVVANGTSGDSNCNDIKDVRPVITLKSSVEILSGDGSMDKPYQIGPVVVRNN